MPVKLICVSHTPLMDFVEAPEATDHAVRDTFRALGEEVKAFNPDVIVIFTPDHFNGFFYDLMPPFCIGLAASCAGDWGIGHGPADVPEAFALDLIKAVQADDVDVSFSYRMTIDHGCTQPLELMFGKVDAYPIVPIFVNGAAAPQPPCRRAVRLGEAVGQFLAGRNERILIMGSGGLSHDPPIPQIATATPERREFLIAGRNPPPEAREARQQNVINAAHRQLEGHGDTLPLDPQWDEGLLESFAAGDLERFRTLTDAEILSRGGRGGHEIRCWIAAFAALQASGPYQSQLHYYSPITEWTAGMAMMSAQPATA